MGLNLIFKVFSFLEIEFLRSLNQVLVTLICLNMKNLIEEKWTELYIISFYKF